MLLVKSCGHSCSCRCKPCEWNLGARVTDSSYFAWDFSSSRVETPGPGNPLVLANWNSWAHLVEIVKCSSTCFISTREVHFQNSSEVIRGMQSPCKCLQMCFRLRKETEILHILSSFLRRH